MVFDRVPRSVRLILPYLPETQMVKYAVSPSRLLILKNVADRLSEPFGLEDDNILEAFVLAVVDNLAKVVQQFGESNNLFIGDPVTLANSNELLIGNLRFGLRAREDLLSGRDPSPVDQLAHLRRRGPLLSDLLAELDDSPAGTIVYLVLTSKHARESILKLEVIHLRMTF